MDPSQYFELLKSHYALLALKAQTPPVALPIAVTKGFEYFRDKHGEENFVPKNFDEVMAACSYTQRKGFEKLQPMFDTLLCHESLEDLLQSPEVVVQSFEIPNVRPQSMLVSKQIPNTKTWAVLELYPQITEFRTGYRVLCRMGLQKQVPEMSDLQGAVWDYSLQLMKDGTVVSMVVDAKLGTDMILKTTSKSKLWRFHSPKPSPPGSPPRLTGPTVEMLEEGNSLDLNIVQPVDDTTVSRMLMEVDGPQARVEVAMIDFDHSKVLDTHWHSEMHPNRFFVRKRGNFIKRIDLEIKDSYEGEVAPVGRAHIPEGKGVWTQAEPFQRKEGIFKAGMLQSGTTETAQTIVYTDDWPAPFPKSIRLNFKTNGKVVQGLYDGAEFVGETLIFIPGDSFYLGESFKLGAHGSGKLWNFKYKVVSEGVFERGYLADGTVYQLAPEETNLPEQEFPDLTTRKLLTKYEGQLNGPLPQGRGVYTNYLTQCSFEGHFEGGALSGPFRQTYFDGCRIEGTADKGEMRTGTFYFRDGQCVELIFEDDLIYVPTAGTPLAKEQTIAKLAHLTKQEFEQMKMRHESLNQQSAQTAAGESKNPENKSNMMAGRDWSVSEGSLTGGNYYQGGHSTSLSFGARLPLGFWPLFGFSRAMIVNTPCWQARPYSTRGLYQGCLQTVLPLRQPVLKMLFRRFK